jgi:hypothetical protein
LRVTDPPFFDSLPGKAPLINFERAFSLAWERMHVILFRPFDFGKWCAIALSAFLAGLMTGGNGYNFNGNFNGNDFNNNSTSTSSSSGATQTPSVDFHQFGNQVQHFLHTFQAGLLISILIAIFVIFFVLMLLFYWLGARGQFMFLDNVVRNRGAIAWPWKTYARQGNSVFFFQLVYLVVTISVFLLIIGLAVLTLIPLIREHRWPNGSEIAIFVFLGLVYIAFALVFSICFFLFTELGIPLMFRNGIMAWPAFKETLGLAKRFPGTITVFVLFRFAIGVAEFVICIILCCGTLCCCYNVPYVGTVLLLPVLVYVKCFTLDCLAQLGPEYDVWSVDVPPTPVPIAPTPGLIPPPQPG